VADILKGRLSTSILDTEVTEDGVRSFIRGCQSWPFYGIAVDLISIRLAREVLEGTEIKVMTVASYPLGGTRRAVKRSEVDYAIREGADEIDACLNYFELKSGHLGRVEEEIAELVETCADKIKLILIPQFAVLTNDEKEGVCQAMLKRGAHNLKTNTGYGYTTVVDDVTFIRRRYGDEISVEVSGGIRTRADAEEVIRAGACLVHTSTPFEVLARTADRAVRKGGTL
jgi:deoxyribose-phosphate aldolase